MPQASNLPYNRIAFFQDHLDQWWAVLRAGANLYLYTRFPYARWDTAARALYSQNARTGWTNRQQLQYWFNHSMIRRSNTPSNNLRYLGTNRNMRNAANGLNFLRGQYNV